MRGYRSGWPGVARAPVRLETHQRTEVGAGWTHALPRIKYPVHGQTGECHPRKEVANSLFDERGENNAFHDW